MVELKPLHIFFGIIPSHWIKTQASKINGTVVGLSQAKEHDALALMANATQS